MVGNSLGTVLVTGEEPLLGLLEFDCEVNEDMQRMLML